ncbi:zinc-dependent alcohol dehydrogenase [Halorientalis marina]|jgi:alcohol dehydrogenase|uniref:zinc-dependent alcohol dehydrogenase n=1 Tax=Halorientalis marina TaxID=2931976 RepID=UPI001FF3E269|nr:zinc-binding alcohol dehydrogenase [Halorientalis marina]
MPARSLYFSDPESVSVEERPVPDPDDDQLLVRTERSFISSGTELLIYRDEAPADIQTDETIDALDGTLSYPLQYGYAAVGQVSATGAAVDDDWIGRRVFAFHPHESHFLATPAEVVPVDLSPDRAALVANAEAAVNFVMDGRPKIGERVAVFGQGVVGLLTTAFLSSFPLGELTTVDCYEHRRSVSRQLGADRTRSPDADVGDRIGDTHADGADLSFEVSGNPNALDEAIQVTGYAGRVVVGSWYGTKPVQLELGGKFHRSHVRVRSSQVSHVDPDHGGRWDKDRRLALVQDLLADVDPDTLITDEFPVERAGEAYEALDSTPETTLGVTLTYD